MYNKNSNLIDTGLLVLRLGLGIIMFLHGLPKLTGGPEVWTGIGGSMSNFGINFAPQFWGFMASFAETIGGLLFAMGLFHRVSSFLLLSTMIVALVMHISKGDSFQVYSHALSLLVVFLASMITGPGDYSLDRKFLPKIS